MAVAPNDPVDPLDDALTIKGDVAPPSTSVEGEADPSDPVLKKHELPKLEKNYDLRHPIVKDMPEDTSRVDNDIQIPGIPDTSTRVQEMLEAVNYKVDPSDESQSWYYNLIASFQSTPGMGLFEERLTNPDSFWRQSLDHNGSRVGGIARPKLGSTSGTRMSHEKQVLAARAKLGIGTPINATLYSSGISVTSKPLGEQEIVALWAEIFDTTLKLGRRTHGMLFSNSQVYTEQAIYRFWLNSIISTSVRDLKLDQLLDILTITDMPAISQAVASSIYPNGFPYQRSLWTEEGLPKAEVRQLLDISKVMFFDEKMLTQEQLDHLAKRNEDSTTLEQVKKYQDSLVFKRQDIIDIGDGIKIHLTTPTLRQYFETGDRWITELNRIVKEALGDEATEQQRNVYVEHLSKASRLCKFAHYVKAIENDEELVDTRAGINQHLEAFSASDWVSEKFYNGIKDYQNASQIAIAATTSCNDYEDAKTAGTRFPRLVPFDPTSIFFQLVEQKLRGIVSRDGAGT